MAIGVYERTDAHRRALSLSHIGNVQSKETREKISKNHIGMKGKKHSEKTKERIRKAKIGSKHSEETKKKMSMNRVGKKPEAYTMLGKKHSEYTKKRISDARIGKWSGEDAPNWRGGKSFENYPREFYNIRDEIRERDAYICQEKQSKLKKALKSTWGQMAVGMGVTQLVASGMRKVVQGIKDTIRVGLEFQAAWANTTTMLSLSAEQTAKMRSELMQLSPTLGGATELAKGLYQVLSASVDPAKALEVLGVSAMSAKAGLTDAFTAVDAITTVLNSYKMEAEEAMHVSDVMFQTVKRGKTTYGELASALGTVTPIASQVGISFEEISGALATMTKQGINVNTATMQLRQVMVSVLKPSKEAQEMAKKLGIEFNATALRAKGLSKFLEDVSEKAGGDAEALTMLFGNVRALTGVMSLAGTSATSFAKDLNAMKHASGSTKEAFEKQMQSTQFWIDTAKNAFDKLKIAIVDGLTKPFRDSIKTGEELETALMVLQQKFIMFGEKVGKVAQVLAHGFKGLADSIRVDLGGALTDTFMEMAGFETLSDENNKLMMQARVEAIQWADGLKFITIELEELADKYKQGTKDGAEWRKEMEALNKVAEEQAQVMVSGFGMMGNAMLTATQKWGEYRTAIIDSNMPVEQQIELLGRARTELFTHTQAVDGATKAQQEFAALVEETGAVTKTMAETKLKIAIANFEELSASGNITKGSLKTLAQEIVKLSTDLDVKVAPSILNLVEKTKKAKKAFDDMVPEPKELETKLKQLIASQDKLVAKGADITEVQKAQENSIKALYEEYLIAGKVWGVQIPADLQKMVDGLKDVGKQASVGLVFLSQSTLELLESLATVEKEAKEFGLVFETDISKSLVKAESAFAHFTSEAWKGSELTKESQKSLVETIIKYYEELNEEVPDKWKNMYKQLVKETKKGASDIRIELSSAFSQMAHVFSAMASQFGGPWGEVFSSLSQGIQQFASGLKDGSKSILEISDGMSLAIGGIFGSIGEAISGAEDSFADLGASIGSSLGGIATAITGIPGLSAVGGALGGLIGGLFGKTEELTEAEKMAEKVTMWTDAIIEKYKEWGEVSEATAEIISKEVVEKGMLGFIAVSKHFAKIIQDVGVTQSNINELWDRADDILDHDETRPRKDYGYK